MTSFERVPRGETYVRSQVYLRLGVRLCVVDFRGYGWSSAVPTLASELLSDMHEVLYHLDELKVAAGLPLDCKVILFGRSMGSIPAAHLAAVAPQLFDGVVIESGVATSGIGKGKVMETADKLAAIPEDVPTLVIHGDVDTIVPYDNAKLFVAARPTARLLTLNAGHNDLLMDPENGKAYFNAVRLLVSSAVSGAPLPDKIPHATGAKPAMPGGFGRLA